METQETGDKETVILAPKRTAADMEGAGLEPPGAKQRRTLVEEQATQRSGSQIPSPCVLGVICQPYPTPMTHDSVPLNHELFAARFFNSKSARIFDEKKYIPDDGEWEIDFDPTLSIVNLGADDGGFLRQGVYVVGSSSGLLFCLSRLSRDESMDYVICNPLTKQFKRLPAPNKAYADCSVAVALICEGLEDPSADLDCMDYKVLRAGPPTPRGMSTTLEMETFSSSASTWRLDCVVASSPFQLDFPYLSPFAIGDVSFWTVVFDDGPQSCPHCRSGARKITGLLAYDCTESGDAKLIKPPDNGDDFDGIFPCSVRFGSCRRKVLYARFSDDVLEIWLLDRYNRSPPDWMNMHTVNLRSISISSLKLRALVALDTYGMAYPQIIAFHPHNMDWVLISFSNQPFWYHMQRQKAYAVGKNVGTKRRYFLYEWHWPSLLPTPLEIDDQA